MKSRAFFTFAIQIRYTLYTIKTKKENKYEST